MHKKERNFTFQKLKRIILSVIIAVVVWLIIISTVNPSINITISDVPVRFLGEASLRENGLVLVNREQLPDFSVKIRGTRKDLLDDLNNVRVDIDLSSIKSQGKVTVNPVTNLPKNISLVKQRFSSVILNVEPKYEKEIPILIQQIGNEPLENCIIKSAPEFNKIKIEGSKKEISSIDNCIINVDISTLNESGKTLYSYYYADKNKQQIAESETIYSSVLTIPVENTIYVKHDLPVELTYDEELLDRYYITFNEKEIEDLKTIVGATNDEDIPEKLIANWENGDYEDGEQEINVKITCPNELYLRDNTVKFKAKLEKRIDTVANVTIEVINVSQGLQVVTPINPLTLKLRLPKSVVGPLRATVDARNLNEGIYNLPLEFAEKSVLTKNHESIKVELRRED